MLRATIATAALALAGFQSGGRPAEPGVPPSTFQGLHWRFIGPYRAGWATVAAGIPDQPNTYYFLTGDVVSNGTCFNVTASNVTIDGKGYLINYSMNGSEGYGVYTNMNYTMVKNAVLMDGDGAGSFSYAIHYDGASHGTSLRARRSSIGCRCHPTTSGSPDVCFPRATYSWCGRTVPVCGG